MWDHSIKKAIEFITVSRKAQLSGALDSSWQTVTVGNWISSMGATIVSSVVMTGLADQSANEKYIKNPAVPKPAIIATS